MGWVRLLLSHDADFDDGRADWWKRDNHRPTRTIGPQAGHGALHDGLAGCVEAVIGAAS